MNVDGISVVPVQTIRDLGIYIDAEQVTWTHVQKMVSRCFAVLRPLRPISHSIPKETLHTLVVTLVLSQLDYGNAMLVGLPAYLIHRLQSVVTRQRG